MEFNVLKVSVSCLCVKNIDFTEVVDHHLQLTHLKKKPIYQNGFILHLLAFVIEDNMVSFFLFTSLLQFTSVVH
jgi:hypothetical protein